jgi:hypothetical protein
MAEATHNFDSGSFKKPKVKLVGEDGNIFNLLGLATRALKKEGYRDQARDLAQRVMNCSSYDEALVAIMEYCDVR